MEKMSGKVALERVGFDWSQHPSYRRHILAWLCRNRRDIRAGERDELADRILEAALRSPRYQSEVIRKPLALLSEFARRSAHAWVREQIGLIRDRRTWRPSGRPRNHRHTDLEGLRAELRGICVDEVRGLSWEPLRGLSRAELAALSGSDRQLAAASLLAGRIDTLTVKLPTTAGAVLSKEVEAVRAARRRKKPCSLYMRGEELRAPPLLTTS